MAATMTFTVIGTAAALGSVTADMLELLEAARADNRLLHSILPESKERTELEMTLDVIREIIVWLKNLEKPVRATRKKEHIRVFEDLRINCVRHEEQWGELVEKQRQVKPSTRWNFTAILFRDDTALKQIQVLRRKVQDNRYNVERASNSITLESIGVDMPVEGPAGNTANSTPQHGLQTEASPAAERLLNTLIRCSLEGHKILENEQAGSLIAMTPLRNSITLSSLKSQLSEPALDPLGAVASFSSDQRRGEKKGDCVTNKRFDNVDRTDAGTSRDKSTASRSSPNDR
ncbi:hypothetical protein BT96DRAFT_1019431 [Gymnopus androsaceus JB14]|uniref:Fungal N-terminal domain-containing protein n=1 Tax=Gymnopus androsaceus JB14 TaxID=1447944 RepID=A0A6A4HRE0_9AGAR|nr:hypothetical protein BT96DRAFT_1019431 [Gymnopus androsaceus JB14]